MQTVVASNFLAGAILSWALPIGLLVVVAIYWTMLVRRRGDAS